MMMLWLDASGSWRKTTSGSRIRSSSSGCGVPPSWRGNVTRSRPGPACTTLRFHTDTVVLLPLVPLVQVAWAEGGVSPQERALIVDLARKRGVQEGSAADRQLAEWLAERPDDDVFTRAARLIRAMLQAGSEETHDLSPDDLVKYCESIAAASGGLLGIGRVSSEERALLKRLADQLKAR